MRKEESSGMSDIYHASWFFCLLITCVIGCSLACAPPRLSYRPLTITYLPGLVKGIPEHFPLHRILVLLPVDKRRGLAVHDGEIPPLVSGADIARGRRPGQIMRSETLLPQKFYPVIGFHGTSSHGSHFIRPPSRFTPPDVPHLFYYLGNLEETVQKALAAHLSEVNLQVATVPFSHLQDRPRALEITADYALACTIEEFSSLSLLYYAQSWRSDFVAVLGPTWVEVDLVLTLYRWPSGQHLWEGRVRERLIDPEPGGDIHIYGSMGETMSVALSRAVGNLLVTPSVQDILSRSP
jgi:hypothetical protein